MILIFTLSRASLLLPLPLLLPQIKKIFTGTKFKIISRMMKNMNFYDGDEWEKNSRRFFFLEKIRTKMIASAMKENVCFVVCLLLGWNLIAKPD